MADTPSVQIGTPTEGTANNVPLVTAPAIADTPPAVAPVASPETTPVTPSNVPITSDVIAPPNPVALPHPANTAGTASTSAIGTMTGINDNIISDLKSEKDALAASAKEQRSVLLRNIDQTTQRGADQTAAEDAANIPALKSTAKSLSQEYNTKQLSYNAQYQAIANDQSLSADQRARQITAVTNDHAYQMIDLAIRSNIANGNYTSAQELVDKKIDIKYGSLKDKIGYQMALLSNDQSNLSDKEKSILTIKMNENQRKLDEVTYQEHNLQETKNDLLKTANENSAPESVKAAIQSATDTHAAINAADKYGTDMLGKRIKEAQIRHFDAESDKLRSEALTARTQLPAGVQTRVQGIAGQFDSEPAIKNYQTLAQTIDAVSNLANTPTDDIRRIYAVAKVFDPNSAVREGEYKTVQDYATSLLQRTGLKLNRVFNNDGFLTEEARTFIDSTLKNELSSSQKAYDNVYKSYGERINKVTGRKDGTDYITDYSQAFKGVQKPITPQDFLNAPLPGSTTSGMTTSPYSPDVWSKAK